MFIKRRRANNNNNNTKQARLNARITGSIEKDFTSKLNLFCQIQTQTQSQ